MAKVATMAAGKIEHFGTAATGAAMTWRTAADVGDGRGPGPDGEGAEVVCNLAGVHRDDVKAGNPRRRVNVGDVSDVWRRLPRAPGQLQLAHLHESRRCLGIAAPNTDEERDRAPFNACPRSKLVAREEHSHPILPHSLLAERWNGLGPGGVGDRRCRQATASDVLGQSDDQITSEIAQPRVQRFQKEPRRGFVPWCGSGSVRGSLETLDLIVEVLSCRG